MDIPRLPFDRARRVLLGPLVGTFAVPSQTNTGSSCHRVLAGEHVFRNGRSHRANIWPDQDSNSAVGLPRSNDTVRIRPLQHQNGPYTGRDADRDIGHSITIRFEAV
ncbi:unnamed protein product [Adineta steineri]|uniref:Uncharacterized protein n=1 Tax=Adineta steineri TaxID=433720 RepID=A0A819VGT6_9BILA|nr:unnamed protein product [Adineta steineri]